MRTTIDMPRTAHAEAQARYYDKKKSDPNFQARRTEINAAHRERQPDAYKARTAVGNAVRDGKIRKPKKCQRCNRKVRLEAHHHDYSKPLEVEWVCVECHATERSSD